MKIFKNKINFFIIQLLIFLFLIVPKIAAVSNDSTLFMADSLQILKERLDILNLNLEKEKQEKVDILLREAEHNVEIASKVIDWSAMILTFLAIGIAFIAFLGWQSVRDIRTQRERMQKELEEMKRLREESSQQVLNLQKQMEKESKMLMDFLYYSNAGDIYYQNLEIESAIKMYQEALNRKSNSAEIRLKLGRSYLRLAKYDEATEEFKKSLEIAPDSAKYDHYVQLGRVYRRKGDIENAKKHYEKALELSPTSTSAMNGLGRIYLKLGDYQQAIYWLEKISTIKNHPIRILHLGIAYFLANLENKTKITFDNVIDISNKILRVNPTDREALYAKAMAYVGLGDELNATNTFESAVQIDKSPGTIDAMKERLNLFSRKSELSVTIEKFIRLIEL